MRSVLLLACLGVSGLSALAGCDAQLGERVPIRDASFGVAVFREVCQRVTYTADLSEPGAPRARPLDASGSSRRALCRGEVEPAADDAPTVRALFGQRRNIITGIDAGIPEQPEDLQGALDGYLRAMAPLLDDGTLPELMLRSGGSLRELAADEPVVESLARLGHLGGMRPRATAGGVVRAVTESSSLDGFIGAALPLLDSGGRAAIELKAALAASAFTLRHLKPDPEEAASPERTPALLRRLLTSTHPELRESRSLLVALRDPRGLPLLAEVVPPFVKDAQGLALADRAGYFIDASGQRVPYLAPLPEAGAAGREPRDALGRALRTDGSPLYSYADLDGSLLVALLHETGSLLADAPQVPGGAPRDVLLGLVRGVALLGGSRAQLSQFRDGETLTYTGFSERDSVLLDLAHGAAQLLRFQPMTAGRDLADALRGVRALLGDPDLRNQSRLARVTAALLAAADEAKRPAHETARLPDGSTLLDDLVPIVQRLLAVDNGQLAEDVVTALGDEHTKNLGPILARLADERSYFFMRAINSSEGLGDLPRSCMPVMNEEVNGLMPCGVLGDFGSRPDRGAPDRDVTLDWRSRETSNPRNNRSVLSRLLHMVADSNSGRPFCNGRGASIFGGLVRFDDECDMFQIDSVARFFLLSVASPALRDRTDTFAKPAASFREAIRSGRLCRGAAPDPAGKCAGMLSTIDDGVNGDRVLEGIMGIQGFGRYPEPPATARALFMDLDGAMSGAPKRTQDLLFNHVAQGAGYIVDAADPDGRKLRDGSGIERRFIDEHNGVLFALEKVRAPATMPDGSLNKYPADTFYEAIRPLIDAFARHAECAVRDGSGACTRWQNATQILADAMTVLHRHHPSDRSERFGRGFAGSYGPQVRPEGAVSYEALLARMLSQDLLPAVVELAPVIERLTVDGQIGGRRALPLLIQLARFAFDPAVGPALRYRDKDRVALRGDGQPAGPVTVFYLIADALKQQRQIFMRPENLAHKAAFEQARSDALDTLLKLRVSVDGMGDKTYAFADPRLRPMAVLLLDFVIERVLAHGGDPGGWADALVRDATDAVMGPLMPAMLDLGVKIGGDPVARGAAYALLRELVADGPAREALAVTILDGVQLMLDEADLLPLGRAVARLLDPDRGPALTAVTLLRRGRELEQASEQVPAPKQTATRMLRSLYRLDADGVHPMSRLSDAIAEVDRAHPAQGEPAVGDFRAADYGSVLRQIADFLIDEQRGLMRLIRIVQARCQSGSLRAGCPEVPPRG